MPILSRLRSSSITPLFTLLIASLVVVLGITSITQASSHREAPLIAGDPKADATDLYAFKSPANANNVVVVANYLPFQEPAGGPNFYSFDDNARYEINIDNNGDAVADVVYRFEFDSSYRNEDTFLYATGPVTSLDDPDLNFRQTYTLTKIVNGNEEVLASNVPVPPSNIGPKTIPADGGDYLALQTAAITALPNGGKVFAGQSEDPFFADLGATFDLLNVRKLPGNDGGGIDTLAGYNVQSLVLEVPMGDVTSDGNVPENATSSDAVIGVWTTASRQSTTVLNTEGSADFSGNWVQVSRLGQPLVNEVVIPVGMKDRFNASQPSDDTQFANQVANPELPQILNKLFGIKVPPQGDFGTEDARDDLVTIFLTGISGLNQPANVTPSEQLRLNLAIPVTAEPNRLGVIAGDNQGFPNGRRLGDDVIDIALRVMAGAAYPLFHPEYTPDPTGLKLGDGVDSNDVTFRTNFPYVAVPYGGYASIPHANAETGPQDDMDEGDMDTGGNDNGGGTGNNEDTVSYRVTIENLTGGQPFSPPVAITHASSVSMFEVGSQASDALIAIAEDGNPVPMFNLFHGADNVTDTVNVGHPLTPNGIERTVDGNTVTSTASFEIEAAPGDTLSLASMLICTNDGFYGLDSIELPTSGQKEYEVSGYDAGTENNTEQSSDLVDPCSLLGPITLAGDPDGNEDVVVTTDPADVIAIHPNIAGNGELTVSDHGWTDPVAKITIERIDNNDDGNGGGNGNNGNDNNGGDGNDNGNGNNGEDVNGGGNGSDRDDNLRNRLNSLREQLKARLEARRERLEALRDRLRNRLNQ